MSIRPKHDHDPVCHPVSLLLVLVAGLADGELGLDCRSDGDEADIEGHLGAGHRSMMDRHGSATGRGLVARRPAFGLDEGVAHCINSLSTACVQSLSSPAKGLIGFVALPNFILHIVYRIKGEA